jgi:hypothetical protein
MDVSITLRMLKRWTNQVLKSVSDNLRVATEKIISALTEAARTISYVETVSNKADTLHRHLKDIKEIDLKRAFEFNTRKAIGRMGMGRVVLALDTTKELYFGKNGKLNVRQVKNEHGTTEAFTYLVLSVVEPKPLPLMAVPYKQGQDITTLAKELLEYARRLPFIIELILFDRGFYIWDLINFLSSVNIRYLIFVPQNEAMKRYISQTKLIASFEHARKYNKRKSKFIGRTKIVVIRDLIQNKKDCFWCFATNLKESLYLIAKYKQRWQIETDFRVQDEARIKTKSNYLVVRYFYFLTSLILLANWEVDRIFHPERCFKRYLKFVQEQFDKTAVT